MLGLIKSKYRKVTEKVIGKSLMDNQGIFMAISGVFHVWKCYTLMAATVLFINMILFGYTCVYFYYTKANMSRFAEVAHYFVVVICAFSFYIVFWVQQSRIYKIRELLDIDFYEYVSTIDPETEEEIREMTLKMKNRKAKLSIFMSVVYNICGFFPMVLLPSVLRSHSAEDIQDNVRMNAPAVCYFPLDGDLGWYALVVLEYMATFFIIETLNGSDVAFICFSEEGCNQLNILCHTIRCALRRARYLHKILFGKEPTELNSNSFSYCLKKCLDDSVKHHYVIISYFQEIQGLFSWCVMVVLMAGGIILCLSGIPFFMDVVDLEMKLIFVFFLSGELIHNFIYAWFGQKISEMSAEIREAVYEVEWEECSKSFRPYLLIIQAYTNTPIMIKGGNFMEYNLNTFGNVCSTAYSYFNILSAAVHSDITS